MQENNYNKYTKILCVLGKIIALAIGFLLFIPVALVALCMIFGIAMYAIPLAIIFGCPTYAFIFALKHLYPKKTSL